MKEFKGVPFYAIAEDVFTVNSEAITSVYGDYTTQEQDEELATLFAAAPELLSALQGMLEINSLNDAGKLSRFKAANAAIAKALGESQ
ncbi:hypothetical protein [Erwinia rhapontici]|uniref:hypothetical protein n=1 Tax=Erwinia rhapontici TaxID=55212 RepID=UPI0013316B12|nr:hypothetical protein [Erwinia rhapontici]MBP2156910.1 hypothetical protein [Erwinia rhapontici]